MKKRHLLTAALAALCVAGAGSSKADVFYFGLQNIAIPTDFNGVYLNLQTGVVASPTFTGTPNWDINPFFGGDGVSTSPNFRPARTGTGNQDPIINLGFGTALNSGSHNYSTGYGGSQGHIGAASNQFQANTAGYIGYQYNPGGAASAFSGWMRAILNPGGGAGGTLMDWAYETTSGAAITTGDIQQAAPVSGISVVTLTAATGESPRLGSVLADGSFGGNPYVTNVTKSGAGTWTLGSGPAGAAHTYTGSTTINGGTLVIDNANSTSARLAGTTSITVNSGGTLLLAQSGATGSTDRINDGATVTMASGSTFNTGGLSEGATPPGAAMGDSLTPRVNTGASVEPGNQNSRWVNLRNRRSSDRLAWSAQQSSRRSLQQNPDEPQFTAEVGRYSPRVVAPYGLGALTLQGTQAARVTFDFGTLGGSTLFFSMLNGASAGTYVNILNWTGMAGTDNGSASNDRFLFASSTGFTTANLANFNFAGYAPGATQIAYNGYFELVPLSAVPEPSTWAAGLLAIAAVVYSQRRRLSKRQRLPASTTL